MHTVYQELSGVWDLGAAGIAVLAGRVHVGQMFDVYLLDGGGRMYALKVPTMRSSTPPVFQASRILGGVSTVWNVVCAAGSPRHVLAADANRPWVPRLTTADLLADEAARLEAGGRSWNQRFVRLLSHDEGGAHSAPGLATDWHYGVPLEAVPRSQLRSLMPFLLVQLWNALSDAMHGDLNGGNVILSPDMKRVTLIDPGAQVFSHRPPDGPTKCADSLTFVTTPRYYPVIPPYMQSEAPLSAGLSLRDHWESFVRSMTLSDQAHSFPAGEHVRGWVVTREGGRFLTGRAAPRGGPHPADALALGILYYEVLTGRLPFPALSNPAWIGPLSIDDHVRGSEVVADTLSGAITKPSAVDPSVRWAEDALALALLDLQVTSSDHLLDLALSAARP